MSDKVNIKAEKRIENLARQAVINLIPYASARAEFAGKAKILLDANENTSGSALNIDSLAKNLNRYPDPLQTKLRTQAAKLFKVRQSQVFVGNGSDEAIDLLMRVFCEPNKDKILITPPTYGMYEVIANILGIKQIKANLDSDFKLNLEAIQSGFKSHPKIFFLCTPNNPTANSTDFDLVKKLAKITPGIMVVDEAYIEFADQPSAVSLINEYPNVVVLRTLSKAWGMAGIRVGFAIGHSKTISLMQKIKFPYNLSSLAQAAAVKALANRPFLSSSISQITKERERLSRLLPLSPEVVRVYKSDASFLLVKFKNSSRAFKILIKAGIVVRDRNSTKGCENCLRISIGTKLENSKMLSSLGVAAKVSKTGRANE